MNRVKLLKRVLSIFLSTALVLSAFSGCSLKKKESVKKSPESQSTEYHNEVNNYFEFQQIDAPGNISAIVRSGKAGNDPYISGYADLNNLMSVNYTTVILNSETGKLTECDLSAVGAIQISNIFVSENGEKLYVTHYDAGYNTIINVIETKSGKSLVQTNLGKEMLISSLKEVNGKVEMIGLAANADFTASPFITYLSADTLEITESYNVGEKIDLSWSGYTNIVSSQEPGVFYAVLISKTDNKILKVIKFDDKFNVMFESEEIQCGELFQAGLVENKDGNAQILLRSSADNSICADIIDKSTGKITRSADFGITDDISGLYTFVPDTGFDFVYLTSEGLFKYDTGSLSHEKIIDFEENNIPENCRNPYFINAYGKNFVFCGQGESKNGGAGYVFIDDEGDEKQFVPVNTDNLYAVTVGKDRSIYYTESVNFGTDEASLQLVKTDISGKVRRIDLETKEPGLLYAGMIKTARDGSVMIGVTNSEKGISSVLMYDSDLKKVFEAECPADSVIDVISTKNSMMMICASDVYLFDVNEQSLKKAENIDFDPDIMTAYESFDEEFDFYYKTSEGIYGYDLENNNTQEIINWIDSDFTNNINNVLVLNKDRMIVTVPAEEGGDNSNIFYLLTRADESKLKSIRKKKNLVAGVMNLTGNDEVIEKILDYNRNNDKYRIVLNDYGKYGYEDKEKGNEGGMAVLNSDIKSGNVPDIILSYGDLDFSVLNQKNTFADLLPYMEIDSEIQKSDFLENIVKAYTTDGKLYAMPVKFGIDAIMGKKSVLGMNKGWKMDEFLEFTDRNEKVFGVQSPDEIDLALISSNLDEFVDFKKKKCKFDTPEFIRLIEMIRKQKPDENSNLADYVFPAKIIGIGDYMSFLYFLSDSNYAEPIFKGLPAEKETGGSINPQMILAISEESKHKEQAWDFARYFLSQEYQDKAFSEAVTYGFPVRKDSFEKMMKKEAGKDFSSFGITADTDGELASVILQAVVSDADNHVVSDSEIKKILRTSLDEFYADKISAEEASKQIQNKVSEYLKSF